MPDPARKPAAPMESKEPRSIRFGPQEWQRIADAARGRGIEASALARQCCLIGLGVIEDPAMMEAHIEATSRLRLAHAGSTR